MNLINKNLISIDDVKRALNVDDFRKVTKDKIMEFVSLIPSMDKEVAMEIIKQFPSFVDFGTTVIEQLRLLVDEALKANDDSQSASLDAYRKVLDELSILLQKEHINEEERKWIVKEMMSAVDKMSIKDTENKKFFR